MATYKLLSWAFLIWSLVTSVVEIVTPYKPIFKAISTPESNDTG